ncbi:MAG: phenylalanine--tRNA ligase subunit beta, partial [Candidatus Eremiobacteraeota bacterium]|nr:phenylalanine--tRNA ligase subunit beta [Candidatus Eremiobacteraeota bacterium]
MRAPLAWLRQYVELPLESQKVADLLAKLGFPVDEIEKRPRITGVVVGRIVELAKHPNADRLQVGKIDIGSGQPLTIATAATNVAVDQVIAVATIGAQLPLLTIERRKMRGLESEGMMISADELALPAEWFEDGILQLDEQTPLGVDPVEYFGLGEDILDVDVTSNRVDAMSMIGLARELAAGTHQPLRLPDFTNPGTAEEASPPSVAIETPACARFVAQRFEHVHVGTSPAWMRFRLALAGQRPINNVVDISNYVMLEVGQPLHFYDEAQVADRHLVVREAKPGERLVTLDGADHTLPAEALVIADTRGALGLAGLKGGKSSEVSAQTTSVLLESANFTGVRIRRTSTALGFRTEAGTRHEKSLAPILTDYGAARAAQLLVETGAHAFAPHAFGAGIESAPPIDFPLDDVARLLGFDLTVEEIRESLDALGFAIGEQRERRLSVTPPPWRRDISIAADVLEEIARMAGYDRLRAEIPAIRDHTIGSRDYQLERKIARTMASLGYCEIISYALHGSSVFEKLARAGVEPSSAPVEVRNP